MLAALLVPLALVLTTAAPANAETCLLASAEKGCIVGTIRTEVDVVPDVVISVEGPNGFSETATTDDRGKWSVAITETGDYTATIDESTLPKGTVVDGSATQEFSVTNLAQTAARTFGVRTGEYSDTVSFSDRVIRSTSAASGSGCSWRWPPSGCP